MEHYKRELAFAIFILVIIGGSVVYGAVTGKLPGKPGTIYCSKNPILFYVALILYTGIATVAAFGAIDLILRMTHHKGLF